MVLVLSPSIFSSIFSDSALIVNMCLVAPCSFVSVRLSDVLCFSCFYFETPCASHVSFLVIPGLHTLACLVIS